MTFVIVRLSGSSAFMTTRWDAARETHIWTVSDPARAAAAMAAGRPWDHRRFETAAAAWRAANRLAVAHSGQASLGESRADTLSQAFGVRARNWREREADRFRDGTYAARPVWADESFWVGNCHVHGDHFAHVSLEDPTQIAFTPDDANGERDRQVRMKAGRYLNRYFGPDSECCALSAKQVEYFAQWQISQAKPPHPGFGAYALKFARTPEEIVEVYRVGPSSCEKGNRAPGCYGAGDLAIAYLEGPEGVDGPRPVIARVLAYPDGKAFGRIYPTPGNEQADGFESGDELEAAREELRNRLRAEGYRSLTEDSSLMNGARILCSWEGSGVPYLDHGTFCGSGLDGVYYLTDGHWEPEEEEELPECDRCGGEYAPDDGYSVGVRMYDHGRYAVSHQTWCEGCYESGTWRCEVADEALSDSIGCVTLADGRDVNERWAARNTFECQYDGERYTHDEESARFPGFCDAYDGDEDAHPELIVERAVALYLGAPDPDIDYGLAVYAGEAVARARTQAELHTGAALAVMVSELHPEPEAMAA